MKFLKELRDFFRIIKLPSEEKEIILYGEHEGYYPYFEGIVEELTESRDTVVTYITSDPDDPVFAAGNIRIRAFYLKKLLPFFMLNVNCRVFVMTLPDLHRFHLKRSANPVHYVYLFHSMVSTHMMYLKGAFDYYDSILTVGPHHDKEIREYEGIHGLKEKELVKGGYYRLERIYRRSRELEKTAKTGGKETVCIAPSWGDKNIIESCGEDLAEALLKNGFCVIMRPHPETVKRSGSLLDTIEKRFREDDDFLLERSVRSDESLLSADVLICDCSGVALEYAFGTERPVLFMDVPYKVRNGDYGELSMLPVELKLRENIGVLLPGDNMDEFALAAKDLIKRKDEYKERIKGLRGKYVYHFNGSSRAGADHILNVCRDRAKEI